MTLTQTYLNSRNSVILSLALALLISSCAHHSGLDNKPNGVGQGIASNNASETNSHWMYSNGENLPYCAPEHFLCAVGSGPSAAMAAAKARGEMAKIFHTQLDESLRVQSATWQMQGNQAPQGSKWENFEKDLKEETSMELEGVEIPLNEKKDTVFYALASLNKVDALKRYKEKMDKIDHELETYFKQKTFISYLQFKRYYLKRAYQNAQYQILARNFYPEKWTKDHLQEKTRCCSTPLPLKIVYGKTVGEEAKSFIEETLTSLGFELNSKEASYKLNVQWMVKDLYIKVQGFQRYEFTLDISAYTTSASATSKTKVEAAQWVSIQSGRDLKQAQEKAYAEIKPQLISKLQTWEFKNS